MGDYVPLIFERLRLFIAAMPIAASSFLRPLFFRAGPIYRHKIPEMIRLRTHGPRPSASTDSVHWEALIGICVLYKRWCGPGSPSGQLLCKTLHVDRGPQVRADMPGSGSLLRHSSPGCVSASGLAPGNDLRPSYLLFCTVRVPGSPGPEEF